MKSRPKFIQALEHAFAKFIFKFRNMPKLRKLGMKPRDFTFRIRGGTFPRPAHFIAIRRVRFISRALLGLPIFSIII